MKRIHPRSRGQAFKILKHSSHLTVVVDEKHKEGNGVGQKVNAHGFRVGVSKPWDAKWYAEKDYAALLNEDVKIREFLKKQLYIAGVSRIEIERSANVSN